MCYDYTIVVVVAGIITTTTTTTTATVLHCVWEKVAPYTRYDRNVKSKCTCPNFLQLILKYFLKIYKISF